MGILKLCDNDPLVQTLAEVFHANIVRVPEERVRPLCVIGAHRRRLAYRGGLGDLLAGERLAELYAPVFKSAEMADVAGKRSRRVDAKLGLDIMGGFLRGFGVPAAAGIQAQFAGAAEVSFSFGKVQRQYIEPSQLGCLLAGRCLDAANPVAACFLQDDAWDCLLIDSVITSSDFSIQVERRAQQDFRLDIPAIEQVLSSAKAGMTVAGASALSLTFQGPKPLTFAFSCQRLLLDQNGKIVQMPPETRNRAFAGTIAPVLLADGPGMLEWDESLEA